MFLDLIGVAITLLAVAVAAWFLGQFLVKLSPESLLKARFYAACKLQPIQDRS